MGFELTSILPDLEISIPVLTGAIPEISDPVAEKISSQL